MTAPRRIVALAVLLVGLGVHDGEAFTTGGEFLRQCGGDLTEAPPVRTGHCLGFVEGVIAGSWAMSLVLGGGAGGRQPGFCLPADGLTYGVALDQIVGWLRRSSKGHPEAAGVAVLWALVESYPCQAPAPKK
jgi:hypothetical protein